MSRQYLDLDVNRNNPAFFSPSTGTQGHNEVTAMHNNPTPDHNQGTQPDEYAERATSTDLPDGFRWSTQKNGKPIAVPTRDNINSLHELCTEVFSEREMRDEEMAPDKQLAAGLGKVHAQLLKANEYMAGGLLYTLARAYAQEMASALSWVRIHAQKIQQHQTSGNEQAAENSLLNLEGSRAQALKAAQVLDWVSSKGVEPQLLKGVTDALGLAGWRLANPQVSANTKAVQQTTRDYLFSKPPKQPDEELERQQERDELDDDLDAMNAA